MALINNRSDLTQGAVLAVANAIWATGGTGQIRIHSAAANLLPALADGEFFEVRDHSQAANNGLYQVETVTTSTDDYQCNKITPGTAIVATGEAITVLGATGATTSKSVHFDVANRKVYLPEQGKLGALGANGDAVYSFFMQEWKNDNFLIANAPFPMNAIDKDAGKYIMGQDSSGNNNGWCWANDVTSLGVPIRTRKMLRNMGWDEISATGITLARYFCAITLGTFEDGVNDNAFAQFGTNTVTDDTFNLTFNGPTNEAIKFYEEQTQPGSLAITGTTITRTGGSFITEGYKVGGQVTIRAAEDAGNNGTFVLTAVSTLVLTTTGLTINAADTTAILSVNNANAFRIGLRVRDGDTYGKTYGEANLASAGKTSLGNFVFAFPLANASDLKITATDANITGDAPYTGMTLTMYATPQSRGGLVGGPYNFGMIINGNNGTNVQIFAWLQYQLRQLSDINSGAGVAIGRAIKLLARFNGNTAEFGSGDGGLNFPTNPEGGGSGVFIDNLNAASDNATRFYDNTGTLRSKPESIAITLDGNAILIGDTASEYDLYFDRTISTDVANFVLTSGTSKITSATTALPNNAQTTVGKYVRVSGLTGGNAAMNGVYQITVITTPGADWTVVRYDGQPIVSVTSTAATIGQNCVDTPNAIIVHTNINVATSADVSFTAAGNTITSAGSQFTVFAVNDRIEISGSTSGLNDGLWKVLTQSATTLTVSGERAFPTTITTQGTGPTVTITKLFSGDFDADVVANFAFDDNVQGGRTVSTTTYVKAKAIGLTSAQYIESPVSTIATGTPLTIPLFSATERNVT